MRATSGYNAPSAGLSKVPTGAVAAVKNAAHRPSALKRPQGARTLVTRPVDSTTTDFASMVSTTPVQTTTAAAETGHIIPSRIPSSATINKPIDPAVAAFNEKVSHWTPAQKEAFEKYVTASQQSESTVVTPPPAGGTDNSFSFGGQGSGISGISLMSPVAPKSSGSSPTWARTQ